MSWLYLPGAVGGVSQPSTCSDGTPSDMSNSQTTPLLLLSSALKTGTSTTRQSGETSGPLGPTTRTVANILARWLRSKACALQQGSPASRSAQQESDGQPTTLATRGLTPLALLEKSGPTTFFWKMSQLSFGASMGISDRFSETWPRAGMMHDGIAYRLVPLARITRETGSGLWRTPSATDGNHGGPNARDSSGALHLSAQAARWPTPNTSDANGYRRSSNKQGGDALREAIGGKLNPDWVEWLMGWPVGWTDLKPLATDRFRQWLRAHGIYLPLSGGKCPSPTSPPP